MDCAICGREIDLDAPPNHRDSLTIDHRVPHSRGGEMYALDNLSPAHKGCNSRKLDTVEYKEVTVNSSRKW